MIRILTRPGNVIARRCHQRPISLAVNESGAILILALVFILVMAISVLGLLTFGGTGLKDAAGLQGQRGIEFAAEGATTAAIQSVRYSFNAYNSGSTPSSCLPPGATTMTIPEGSVNYQMEVDCSGTLNVAPTPLQYTRVVTFYACQSGPTPPSCNQGNAVVIATVNFQDLSASGVNACYDSSDTGTCGTAMVISSWNVKYVNT